MRLDALLHDTDLVPLNREASSSPHLSQNIENVTLDSRKAAPGALFIASKGATATSRDGHAFVAQVAQQGIAGIVVEDAGTLHGMDLDAPGMPPIWQTSRSRTLAARLSEKLNSNPSSALQLCGVTGTNGKTTVAFLTAAIAKAAGKKSAVLGTLGYGEPGQLHSTGFTTPEAETLSQVLASLVQQGFGHVTMEVSSIALSTERVDGLHFQAGAFTNLSVDHLDFHGDMERYRQAKERFFTELLPASSSAVLPEDHELVSVLKAQSRPVLTWGRTSRANLWAGDIHDTTRGIAFTLHFASEQVQVRSELSGSFNVDNMLCAAGLGLSSGATLEQIAQGLGDAKAPSGRLERVVVNDASQKPLVFVDFAHTPDALERTLKALRSTAQKRLIIVFGCGGDRDKTKRPQMGQIASDNADLIFITDDNPRHENPKAIRQEVFAGVPEHKRDHCHNVGDRAAAIRSAIHHAQPSDLVLIAGKGHETTQQINDTYFPFCDQEVARLALEEWPK